VRSRRKAGEHAVGEGFPFHEEPFWIPSGLATRDL
jgi:hypothetical protein